MQSTPKGHKAPPRGRTGAAQTTRMKMSIGWIRPLVAGLLLFGVPGAGAATADTAADTQVDSGGMSAFTLGFATAVLERELGLAAVDYWLEANGTELRVGTRALLAPAQREHLREALAGHGVSVVFESGAMPEVPPPEVVQEALAASRPAPWFPQDTLFRPLLADPREPRFFVSARYYDDDPESLWLSEVGYGERFGIYRWTRGEDAWQIGVSGGLFGLFNLEAESQDLINADYMVGIPLTWQRGDRSMRVRLYHQSSHLGDEFILNTQADRINLSFESLEVLYAERRDEWRMYGGGEMLLHREPSDLDRFMLHGGAERTPVRTLELASVCGGGRCSAST